MSRPRWLTPAQLVLDGVLIGEGVADWSRDPKLGALLIGFGIAFLGVVYWQTRYPRVRPTTMRFVASAAQLIALAEPFPPTVTWVADDGRWVAGHPEWPQVVATGATEAQTRENWDLVCGMAVCACREAGIPVPPGDRYVIRPLNQPMPGDPV